MSDPVMESSEAWKEAVNEETAKPLTTAEIEGPGRFLKSHREAAGMSVTEAASRLNINVHQVEALEADDYEQLPAPIFVRNFLQRYARLFGLPTGPILESYERLGGVVQPQLARVSLREKLNSRNASVRWATYAVGALTVGLIAFWVWTAIVPEIMDRSSRMDDASSEIELAPNQLSLPAPSAESLESLQLDSNNNP